MQFECSERLMTWIRSCILLSDVQIIYPKCSVCIKVSKSSKFPKLTVEFEMKKTAANVCTACNQTVCSCLLLGVFV